MTVSVSSFLRSTITSPEGYLCLALRAPTVDWHEMFFKWPEQCEQAAELVYTRRDEYDCYFSSYLFKSPSSSTKQNALPSRTIQADLDGADVKNLPLKPGTLVRTSPGRYQAYWYLKPEDTQPEPDLELLELLSKRLTYSILDSDRSGWSVAHKVRVADSYNHKYIEGDHLVEVVETSSNLYSIDELELLPDVDSLTLEHFDSEFIYAPPSDQELRQKYQMGPNELLETIRPRIPLEVYVEYRREAPDRSVALWALTCSAFRAGLNREQVYYLALNSANNKFARLRYHAERELAKDVLRAEHHVFTIKNDPRTTVADLRKIPHMGSGEKNRTIFSFIYAHMQEEGNFISTPAKMTWYVPKDTGKPVPITKHGSDDLDALLDIRYNLNSTETEHKFSISSLCTQTNAQATNGIQGCLSFFDAKAQPPTLYVHGGRKDVFVVRGDSIDTAVNGTGAVVFPWGTHTPFKLVPITRTDISQPLDWANILFGSLTNATEYTPEEARLILKVWFMFIFFREAAQSRPILALLGMPGSSKTTTMHRVYALLYGTTARISAITNQTNYDYSVTNKPLVAYDNVDTWESWLPDRLAQSAAPTDVDIRKLYSNTDIVTLRRDAMVALTAHSPKFTREDVTDRLIIINLSRLEMFAPEGPMIDTIYQHRDKLWSSVLQTAQNILRNPLPTSTDLRFRIADFARLGEWIAKGFSSEEHTLFRSLIPRMMTSQTTHNLSTDQPLVQCSISYARSGGTKGLKTAEEIYREMNVVLTPSERSMFVRAYKNHIALDKKLWTMMESLLEVVYIRFEPGAAGTRLWEIKEKQG